MENNYGRIFFNDRKSYEVKSGEVKLRVELQIGVLKRDSFDSG